MRRKSNQNGRLKKKRRKIQYLINLFDKFKMKIKTC